MIAFARSQNTSQAPSWQAGFLELLPDIRSHLRFHFRSLRAEERDEAMAEAVANAAAAYCKLHRMGKVDLAYPTPLARFAAAQYRAGRRIGARCNVNDVMSPAARRRHGINVQRLDRFDREDGWKEALVEDSHCTPAQLAASRIDFGVWFKRLSRPKRRIAKMLATGESTSDAARKVGLSRGRISQIRGELSDDWRQFHGEPPCRV